MEGGEDLLVTGVGVEDVIGIGIGDGDGDVMSNEAMEKGSLSPLTGSYLLIVLAEPHSEQDREIILQRLNKGLLSWDTDSTHVDLNCELLNLANSSPEGDEARNGEKLVQWASENLVVEVLIHSQVNTLQQCMKNLLASFTRHRHIIHAGYTFQGSGSWALQDGTFSLSDYLELWGEPEVTRILSAYKGDISVSLHCASEGLWTEERFSKEPFAKMCQTTVNPPDRMSRVHNSGIGFFIEYISKMLIPSPLKEILEPSEIVGNIRFSHPTLYVFPGGQGDAALFGINGFNMLIDGGFPRRSCFWDFTRHLDRLDAVLLTRINNNSVGGLSSIVQRKVMNQVYPQIGHFFGNLLERKSSGSGNNNGEKESKDKEKQLSGVDDPAQKLLVSLTDEGQKILDNLRNLNLKPHMCFRESVIEPINLYHKVGHGKLDLYILNPARDSREVKEFLSKWNSDCKSFVSSRISSRHDGKDFQYPVLNLVSICALLVWQPANPRDPITRILFPGSTPQHKIFEVLQKLKHLEFLKYPVCSAKTIAASNKSKVKSEKVISEAKQQLSKVSDASLSRISARESSTTSRVAPDSSNVNVNANTISTSHHLSKTTGSSSSSSTALHKSSSKTTVGVGVGSVDGATTTSNNVSGTLDSSSTRATAREKKKKIQSKIDSGLSNDSNKSQTQSPIQKRPLRSASATSRVTPSGKTSSSSTSTITATATSTGGKITSSSTLSKKKMVVSEPPSSSSSSSVLAHAPAGTGTGQKKSSPTSPAKKHSIGSTVKGSSSTSASLSKTTSSSSKRQSATTEASPIPPSTPLKSAKEASNRRVIEHKSSTAKTEKERKTTGEVAVKKRSSSSSVATSGGRTKTSSIPSTTSSTTATATAPKSPKKTISTRSTNNNNKIISSAATTTAKKVVKEIVTEKEIEKKRIKEDQSSIPYSDDPELETEKKIQAETNGSLRTEEEKGKQTEAPETSDIDKDIELDMQVISNEREGEEPTSLPPSASAPPPYHITESGSELSSLDHMSVNEEAGQEEGEEGDVVTPSVSLSKDQEPEIKSRVVESEQEEEEDEYLVVEKDESIVDNVTQQQQAEIDAGAETEPSSLTAQILEDENAEEQDEKDIRVDADGDVDMEMEAEVDNKQTAADEQPEKQEQEPQTPALEEKEEQQKDDESGLLKQTDSGENQTEQPQKLEPETQETQSNVEAVEPVEEKEAENDTKATLSSTLASEPEPETSATEAHREEEEKEKEEEEKIPCSTDVQVDEEPVKDITPEKEEESKENVSKSEKEELEISTPPIILESGENEEIKNGNIPSPLPLQEQSEESPELNVETGVEKAEAESAGADIEISTIKEETAASIASISESSVIKMVVETETNIVELKQVVDQELGPEVEVGRCTRELQGEEETEQSQEIPSEKLQQEEQEAEGKEKEKEVQEEKEKEETEKLDLEITTGDNTQQQDAQEENRDKVESDSKTQEAEKEEEEKRDIEKDEDHISSISTSTLEKTSEKVDSEIPQPHFSTPLGVQEEGKVDVDEAGQEESLSQGKQEEQLSETEKETGEKSPGETDKKVSPSEKLEPASPPLQEETGTEIITDKTVEQSVEQSQMTTPSESAQTTQETGSGSDETIQTETIEKESEERILRGKSDDHDSIPLALDKEENKEQDSQFQQQDISPAQTATQIESELEKSGEEDTGLNIQEEEDGEAAGVSVPVATPRKDSAELIRAIEEASTELQVDSPAPHVTTSPTQLQPTEEKEHEIKESCTLEPHEAISTEQTQTAEKTDNTTPSKQLEQQTQENADDDGDDTQFEKKLEKLELESGQVLEETTSNIQTQLSPLQPPKQEEKGEETEIETGDVIHSETTLDENEVLVNVTPQEKETILPDKSSSILPIEQPEETQEDEGKEKTDREKPERDEKEKEEFSSHEKFKPSDPSPLFTSQSQSQPDSESTRIQISQEESKIEEKGEKEPEPEQEQEEEEENEEILEGKEEHEPLEKEMKEQEREKENKMREPVLEREPAKSSSISAAEQLAELLDEGGSQSKFIRPLPYEETLDTPGAIQKILQMKQPNEPNDLPEKGEKTSTSPPPPPSPSIVPPPTGPVSATSAAPSAIPPKLPRESREVIRTPDEVADLPVHEEVEPGTYETDEVLDERPLDEYYAEDPGVEVILISHPPPLPPTTPKQQEPETGKISQPEPEKQLEQEQQQEKEATEEEGEKEKPDQINISHEFIHQEIIQTSSDMGNGEVVKKIDAAVSPVLESLLGQSPTKAFPGTESQPQDIQVSTEAEKLVEIPNETQIETEKEKAESELEIKLESKSGVVESGNEIESIPSPKSQEEKVVSIEKEIIKSESDNKDKELAFESESQSEPQEQADKKMDIQVEKDSKSMRKDAIQEEEEEEEEEEHNKASTSTAKTDMEQKKLSSAIDRLSMTMPSTMTMTMTSVVITPSTPPVHIETTSTENEFTYEQTATQVESENKDVASPTNVTTPPHPAETPAEADEIESEAQIVVKSVPPKLNEADLNLLAEADRKLSGSEESSPTSSSATPLTAVSKDRDKEKDKADKIHEEELIIQKDEEIPSPTTTTEIEKESPEPEPQIQKESDLKEEIETVERTEKREKLFSLPGVEDEEDKSDIEDEDIYETDEPALGAIRSGLLTAAATLSAALISQSPEDLAVIPTPTSTPAPAVISQADTDAGTEGSTTGVGVAVGGLEDSEMESFPNEYEFPSTISSPLSSSYKKPPTTTTSQGEMEQLHDNETENETDNDNPELISSHVTDSIKGQQEEEEGARRSSDTKQPHEIQTGADLSPDTKAETNQRESIDSTLETTSKVIEQQGISSPSQSQKEETATSVDAELANKLVSLDQQSTSLPLENPEDEKVEEISHQNVDTTRIAKDENQIKIDTSSAEKTEEIAEEKTAAADEVQEEKVVAVEQEDKTPEEQVKSSVDALEKVEERKEEEIPKSSHDKEDQGVSVIDDKTALLVDETTRSEKSGESDDRLNTLDQSSPIEPESPQLAGGEEEEKETEKEQLELELSEMMMVEEGAEVAKAEQVVSSVIHEADKQVEEKAKVAEEIVKQVEEELLATSDSESLEKSLLLLEQQRRKSSSFSSPQDKHEQKQETETETTEHEEKEGSAIASASISTAPVIHDTESKSETGDSGNVSPTIQLEESTTITTTTSITGEISTSTFVLQQFSSPVLKEEDQDKSETGEKSVNKESDLKIESVGESVNPSETCKEIRDEKNKSDIDVEMETETEKESEWGIVVEKAEKESSEKSICSSSQHKEAAVQLTTTTSISTSSDEIHPTSTETNVSEILATTSTSATPQHGEQEEKVEKVEESRVRNECAVDMGQSGNEQNKSILSDSPCLSPSAPSPSSHVDTAQVETQSFVDPLLDLDTTNKTTKEAEKSGEEKEGKEEILESLVTCATASDKESSQEISTSILTKTTQQLEQESLENEDKTATNTNIEQQEMTSLNSFISQRTSISSSSLGVEAHADSDAMTTTTTTTTTTSSLSTSLAQSEIHLPSKEITTLGAHEKEIETEEQEPLETTIKSTTSTLTAAATESSLSSSSSSEKSDSESQKTCKSSAEEKCEEKLPELQGLRMSSETLYVKQEAEEKEEEKEAEKGADAGFVNNVPVEKLLESEPKIQETKDETIMMNKTGAGETTQIQQQENKEEQEPKVNIKDDGMKECKSDSGKSSLSLDRESMATTTFSTTTTSTFISNTSGVAPTSSSAVSTHLLEIQQSEKDDQEDENDDDEIKLILQGVKITSDFVSLSAETTVEETEPEIQKPTALSESSTTTSRPTPQSESERRERRESEDGSAVQEQETSHPSTIHSLSFQKESLSMESCSFSSTTSAFSTSSSVGTSAEETQSQIIDLATKSNIQKELQLQTIPSQEQQEIEFEIDIRKDQGTQQFTSIAEAGPIASATTQSLLLNQPNDDNDDDHHHQKPSHDKLETGETVAEDQSAFSPYFETSQPQSHIQVHEKEEKTIQERTSGFTFNLRGEMSGTSGKTITPSAVSSSPITRRFSSQEVSCTRGGVGGGEGGGIDLKSTESLQTAARRRASEITEIEHCEEIYAGSSLHSSAASAFPGGAAEKQLSGISQGRGGDGEIPRTSPSSGTFGGYGYVFGSAGTENENEMEEDEESVYGEDSGSQSISNQSVIISTQEQSVTTDSTSTPNTTSITKANANLNQVTFPLSTSTLSGSGSGSGSGTETVRMTSTTTTTVTVEPLTVGVGSPLLLRETEGEESRTTIRLVGDVKSEMVLDKLSGCSSGHIAMSYDLMEEGSYSSGDFSDSQLSTVAGMRDMEEGGEAEVEGFTDDVHNYGYEEIKNVQGIGGHSETGQPITITTTSTTLGTTSSGTSSVSQSQDFENGNLPITRTVTTGDIISHSHGTSSSTVTSSTTTTTSQSSHGDGNGNGNGSDTILTKLETSNKGKSGEESMAGASGSSVNAPSLSGSSSDASKMDSSTTERRRSSTSLRQKTEEEEDIVKTWGKPLGLPMVLDEVTPLHQNPTNNNNNNNNNNEANSGNAAAAAASSSSAAAESNAKSGGRERTPKKDRSVDRKNVPGTPGKASSSSSHQRGRSHHRSTKNTSPIYVDLAYVPHHGNSNYCDSEFFRLIRSRYYVFSGLEPSRQVFDGLLQGKQAWDDKNLETTIIPTYDSDTLGYWISDLEDSLSQAKIDLAPSASRCTINLQDHETSCSAYRLEF